MSRPDDAVLVAQIQPAADQPQKQGMQTRKRVLPSRSRRGGPGVGGCDVDVMILETRKRRLENEPLIPPSTKFILTTNHALVPAEAADDDDPALNTQAYSRYFDRPDVQAACRAQELIQTPEFTQLSDDALVGGRFRPRNSDEELVDTSDAAYEKRHRKYETFEKRQRLREKEKLKHEQYKLKERIEQLRAMDTSAFLALPASSFSEPPGAPHELEHDEVEPDPGMYDLPGVHVNGAAAYNEGERRRSEMLEIAEGLEDRYRVLLPPDRKWQEKKERLEREKREKASASVSVEPQPEEITVESSESEEEEALANSASVSVSARPHRYTQENDGESEVELDLRAPKLKKLKLRIPPRRTNTPVVAPPDSPVPSVKKLHHNSTAKALSVTGLNGRHHVRAPDGRFLSMEKRMAAAAGESISVPPRKRPRASLVDLHTSPTKSVSSTDGGGRKKQQCILLTAAMRNAATQNSRKTHRHVTAFGVRVPPEIEEVRDYELPYWVTEDSEAETEWEEPEENGLDDDSARSDHPEDATSDIEWENGAGDEHDIPPESEG